MPVLRPNLPARTIFLSNGCGRYLGSPVSSYNTFMIARQISNPIKSPNSNGPIGWFAPNFIAVSIPSTEATPSARMPTPSFTYGIKILFTTKPAASFTSTGVLPISLEIATILSFNSSGVFSPLITSVSYTHLDVYKRQIILCSTN